MLAAVLTLLTQGGCRSLPRVSCRLSSAFIESSPNEPFPVVHLPPPRTLTKQLRRGFFKTVNSNDVTEKRKMLEIKKSETDVGQW